MSTTALHASASGASSKVATAAWWLVLAVAAYFVIEYIPRYLVWSAESYGPYFWPRAGYLLPHLLGGLVAMLVGPLQLWPRMRNRHPRIHRISGRIYLGAVLIGALAGIVMALTSGVSTPYAAGLFTLAIAWLLTSGMALAAIKRRNFVQHKQWMIRSYVVTLSFVSFRIVDDTLVYFGVGNRVDNVAMLAWAAWAVPLLLTEMAIQGREIFAGASRGRPGSHA